MAWRNPNLGYALSNIVLLSRLGSNEKLTSPQNDVSISFDTVAKKNHAKNRNFGRIEPYPKRLWTYQGYQTSLVLLQFLRKSALIFRLLISLSKSVILFPLCLFFSTSVITSSILWTFLLHSGWLVLRAKMVSPFYSTTILLVRLEIDDEVDRERGRWIEHCIFFRGCSLKIQTADRIRSGLYPSG